ncbi:hypothetical protein NC652_017908 [Populus alba x Populus x berolinensis]|nr:hypothetical protein NC652_017908 [Populus alba x Populus x berolinensis]
MTDFSMVNRRYSYLPECKWLLEATDMHHVVVRKSKAKDFFVCLSALIVVANARRFWKNCPSLYSNLQDFETCTAGMCISSYLLLELVSASAWRSRTSELRPHVKMLILIWKALCDASGIKEGADTWEDAN